VEESLEEPGELGEVGILAGEHTDRLPHLP